MRTLILLAIRCLSGAKKFVKIAFADLAGERRPYTALLIQLLRDMGIKGRK